MKVEEKSSIWNPDYAEEIMELDGALRFFYSKWMSIDFDYSIRPDSLDRLKESVKVLQNAFYEFKNEIEKKDTRKKYKVVIECNDDSTRFLASNDLSEILGEVNLVGWKLEREGLEPKFYWKQYPEGQDFLEELSYPWEAV